MNKILLLVLTLSISTAWAQTFNSSAHGFTFSIDYAFTGEIDNQVDSVFSVNAIIALTDTTHISKIYLQVGTSLGAYDEFNEVFEFDNPTEEQELIYNRTQNQITIGIGRPESSALLYYEVRLEDIYGNISEAVTLN